MEFREGKVFSCVCPQTRPPQTSDLGLPTPHGPGPGPISSATDIWWPQLEACSNLFTWGPPPQNGIWLLPLKHVWFASDRYSSYWNVFLFQDVDIVITKVSVSRSWHHSLIWRDEKFFIVDLFVTGRLSPICASSSTILRHRVSH